MDNLDRRSPTPLYAQLKAILHERILSGEYAPGDRIPTERELCQRYGVSRITVVRALNDLAREGFIERIQGKGSLVTWRPIEGSLNRVTGFTHSMRAQGFTTRSRVLSIETIPADQSLRAAFRLPPDSEQRFVRFRRLRFVDDRPAVILTSIVPEDVGTRLMSYDLESISFYDLFEALLGRRIARTEVTLAPIIATPEAIELLEVDEGSPQMLYRGISYLEGDIPIEVATGIFRGDTFQFVATIQRAHDAPFGRDIALTLERATAGGEADLG